MNIKNAENNRTATVRERDRSNVAPATARRSELPFIPVAKPVLDQREADRAAQCILSGWVTQGEQVASFEREFAETVGSPHAVAVANCTCALHLALHVAGVSRGDEVITPSHSFIAGPNAIRLSGATPVFVDIEPRTFNLDVASIEQAITKHTRAILCVHQMGMPCDISAIVALARRHDLVVIEDAACAIGSEVRIGDGWERIGQPHGDIACFSFHPRKLITTGDGGMITTRRSAWDASLRLLRQHGMSVSDMARHRSRQVVFESYPVPGFNYRLTDIQAAVGREQLTRVDDIVARRRQLARRYRELLSGAQTIVPPDQPQWARSNWQSYCVRLPAHCDRRAVMQFMLDQGIATRRGVLNAHLEQACGDVTVRHPLPESESASAQTVILPMLHDMTDADQERVVEALREGCRRS